MDVFFPAAPFRAGLATRAAFAAGFPDWPGLTRLLPEARRRKLLAPAALDALELETHRELLGLDLPPGELTTLQRAWDEVPARLRQHPSRIATYARQLQRQGAAEDCARLLTTALEHGWDETLARLYGDTVTAQPGAQLETAEEWVARHGESAGLLLTLGKLAHRQRLLDRARSYLERSLAREASPAAHEELARVFEAGGDAAQALHHYRRALDLCQEAPLAQQRAAAAATATRLSDYGYCRRAGRRGTRVSGATAANPGASSGCSVVCSIP